MLNGFAERPSKGPFDSCSSPSKRCLQKHFSYRCLVVNILKSEHPEGQICLSAQQIKLPIIFPFGTTHLLIYTYPNQAVPASYSGLAAPRGDHKWVSCREDWAFYLQFVLSPWPQRNCFQERWGLCRSEVGVGMVRGQLLQWQAHLRCLLTCSKRPAKSEGGLLFQEALLLILVTAETTFASVITTLWGTGKRELNLPLTEVLRRFWLLNHILPHAHLPAPWALVM